MSKFYQALTARVGADVTGFNKGLKNASGSAKRFSGGLKRMFSGAVGVLGLGGLGFSAKAFASELNQIRDEANQLNVTPEFFQTMRELAKQSGMDSSGLWRALRNIQDRAIKAAEGSQEMDKAFRAIGLSAHDIIKLSPEDAFKRVMEAVSEVEDPMLRMSKSMKVFGEVAGVQLKPVIELFNQMGGNIDDISSKLKNQGLVFDNEFVNKIADANTELDKYSRQLKGLIAVGLTKLIGVLTPIGDTIGKVINFVRSGKGSTYGPAVNEDDKQIRENFKKQQAIRAGGSSKRQDLEYRRAIISRGGQEISAKEGLFAPSKGAGEDNGKKMADGQVEAVKELKSLNKRLAGKFANE